jgi:hypothetical protein
MEAKKQRKLPYGIRLKIPNYSIKMVYWEYIQRMLEDDNQPKPLAHCDKGIGQER